MVIDANGPRDSRSVIPCYACEEVWVTRSMRREVDDGADTGDHPNLIARDILDAIDACYRGGDQYLLQLIVGVWTRLTLEG